MGRVGGSAAGGGVTILGVRRLKCRLGDVVAFSLDLRVPPMPAFVPRQCCQHSLLVAPCLLLDFSVLELVDIHLSLFRVRVDRGAVEEVLRQGRVCLLARAARGLHVRQHGIGCVRFAVGLFQKCLC
jgi:hypothetical protein